MFIKKDFPRGMIYVIEKKRYCFVMQKIHSRFVIHTCPTNKVLGLILLIHSCRLYQKYNVFIKQIPTKLIPINYDNSFKMFKIALTKLNQHTYVQLIIIKSQLNLFSNPILTESYA